MGQERFNSNENDVKRVLNSTDNDEVGAPLLVRFLMHLKLSGLFLCIFTILIRCLLLSKTNAKDKYG